MKRFIVTLMVLLVATFSLVAASVVSAAPKHTQAPHMVHVSHALTQGIEKSESAFVADGEPHNFSVDCSAVAGSVLSSGGFKLAQDGDGDAYLSNLLILKDGPSEDGTKWEVMLSSNDDSDSNTIDVFAVCLHE